MTHATSFVRFAASLLSTLLLASVTSTTAIAGETGITIVRVSGAVKLLSAGKPVVPSSGAKVAAPLKIETGADGWLRVEQASGTVDVGPNSIVLLPVASAEKETIVQSLGRVLYSVKPRKARTFAVETPYLVSVVKGTVFSVAIDDDATSVSLLEGSVELVADDIDTVLLQPNETARRGANDRAINVTPIEASRPSARAESAAPAATGNATALAPTSPSVISDAMLADLNEVAAVRRDALTQTIDTPTTPGVTPTVPEGAPTPSPAPQEPAPVPPQTPDVTPPTAPTPNVPGTSPAPVPTPHPVPVPTPNPTPTPSDDDCRRGKCDSPHDHDHGPGNDDDDED